MNCVLLETSRLSSEERRSYFFLNPTHIISIRRLEDVPHLFSDLEQYISGGFFVAGYFGYECGYHFEEIAPHVSLHPSLPLAWFGVYRTPLIFNHETGAFENDLHSIVRDVDPSTYSLEHCALGISDTKYIEKIAAIKAYIISGDTYQVNFTNKYTFDFHGSPVSCFASLKEKQKVGYSAFINANGKHLLSFSPELFFKMSEGRITTKPMKGTARRGINSTEDAAIMHWLKNDEKNRSENLMIVDLLRNDIGRISEVGSVEVKEMYNVEKYETLFQMTSTVEGKLRPGLSLYEIFRSIYPSGSVTGAPKIRTMQIIHEMEAEPRGVYTGAIGFFSPKKGAVFNVAIRTLVIDGSRGEMGVGSGIVFDSDAGREYEECRLKAEFLTQPVSEFQLIESILWDGEYRLRELHLERLQASAEYFDFQFNKENVLRTMTSHQEELSKSFSCKIRLLLSGDGTLSIEDQPLTQEPSTLKIAFSDVRTSSNNRFLYHKTTERKLYDDEFTRAKQHGCADIVFGNERNEVTEGAISNLFIERDGMLYTPPLGCGLLPGVFRRHILETRTNATERILVKEDLMQADAIYICNAIRGLRRVTLATA